MIAEIKKHLEASPANRVVVSTHTRHTIYSAKNLAQFVREDANGVYIKRGKATDYVFNYLIRFGHYN